jgi:integrase
MLDMDTERGSQMREMNLLTEFQVKNAKPDKGKFVARLLDGANLYLQVTRSGNGFNRNWVFRYELDGERHDLGLGPLHTVSLGEARRRATQLRLQILDGIDPAQERADLKAERLARRAEKLKATTFQACADAYYKIHHTSWSNDKHRKQWASTMRDYVYPIIGGLNINDIETAHIEKVLTPIWGTKAETASRVQKRIEHVFNYAIAGKLRVGDNPARREYLKALLGKIVKNVEHHAALPLVEAPSFMAELRKRDSISARALEFTILTAVRTGETIGALWDEIDLKNKLWIIPKERMKSGREHRVPLCDRAVEILKSLPHRGPHVFVNGSKKPLSNMAMLELLRGMSPGHTVHGFRSTFRDWAAERTNYPEFVIEMALAHAVGDAVIKAYKRTDLFERRVRLMKQWAEYLAKPLSEAEITELDARRKKHHG